jgi:hypothetical protein
MIRLAKLPTHGTLSEDEPALYCRTRGKIALPETSPKCRKCAVRAVIAARADPLSAVTVRLT